MPRPPAISQNDLLAQMTAVFRAQGFDGTSVSDLAAGAGLQKASLYHRFPQGKAEMAVAAIDDVAAGFKARLEGLDGRPPAERLAGFLDALGEYFDGGQQSCLMGNLALSAPGRDIGDALARTFGLWTDTLARLLAGLGLPPAKARRRAEEVVIRLEGALILSRALRRPTIMTREIDHIRAELLTGN